MEAISGPFMVDWKSEGLNVVPRTILKKYNAEIHSQSALEAMLEVRDALQLHLQDVERIELDTFDGAFHIIGGGEEASKYLVQTKEEADHSVPNMLAAALFDGEVMPSSVRARHYRGPMCRRCWARSRCGRVTYPAEH